MKIERVRQGNKIPFLLSYSHYKNLIKMQIPYVGVFARSYKFCLATTGVCVFCALTSVGALFIYKGVKL